MYIQTCIYDMARQIRSQQVGLSTLADHMNNELASASLHNQGGRAKAARKRAIGIWNLRLPESSIFAPVRFLKHIRAEVARAIRLVSSSSSSKVCSSSLSLARSQSWSCAHQIHESHKAEAIEDCIQFLNSSSSLHRSNSVSSTSC